MYVFVAVLYAAGLYLSTLGFIGGTYLLFGLLSTHIVVIVFVSSVMLGTSNRKAQEKAKILPENMLLGQAFVGIAACHMFMMGYLFIAGAISATLTIAVIGNVMRTLIVKGKLTQ